MSKSMDEKQQPTAVHELVAVDDDVEELVADSYDVPVPFEVDDDVPDPRTLTSEEYLQLMETPEIRALINLYRQGDFVVPPSPEREAFAAATVDLIPPGANQEAVANAVEDPAADVAQDAAAMVANLDHLEGN